MAANSSNTKRKGTIKDFFKGVITELKKVHWPSRKQVSVYTGVVIVTVLLVAVVVSAVDFGLSSLLGLVIER
jgi:preprotein translocase subunit SecE